MTEAQPTESLLTEDQLAALSGSKRRAEKFIGPLTAAMARFYINTPPRKAAFLAQVMHESGKLRYVCELASGEAYEGRRDLGNTKPGDGRRYRGRGLIQITGRANYSTCSRALYGDDRLIDEPTLLEQPEAACLSAGWYWSSRNLNHLADTGQFVQITRRINGGINGLPDRLTQLDRAKTLFGEST